MGTNNLFQIPEMPAAPPVVLSPGPVSAPRLNIPLPTPTSAPMAPAHQMPAHQPQQAAASHVYAYPLDEEYDSNRPAGGLDTEAEFSTGRFLRPVQHDELPLIPQGHGGRAKLAVMLCVVAVLIVGAIGTMMVFAAGR